MKYFAGALIVLIVVLGVSVPAEALPKALFLSSESLIPQLP